MRAAERGYVREISLGRNFPFVEGLITLVSDISLISTSEPVIFVTKSIGLVHFCGKNNEEHSYSTSLALTSVTRIPDVCHVTT